MTSEIIELVKLTYCPVHPKYKGVGAPSSKKEGCVCAEIYAGLYVSKGDNLNSRQSYEKWRDLKQQEKFQFIENGTGDFDDFLAESKTEELVEFIRAAYLAIKLAKEAKEKLK